MKGNRLCNGIHEIHIHRDDTGASTIISTSCGGCHLVVAGEASNRSRAGEARRVELTGLRYEAQKVRVDGHELKYTARRIQHHVVQRRS